MVRAESAAVKVAMSISSTPPVCGVGGQLGAHVQMSGPTSWNAELAAQIVGSHLGREGPLLPILHDLQHSFGYIDEAAVPIIALALNLSRAEVHGVISFYHDFRHEPAGRRIVRLCQAEACQARGSRGLTAMAESRLGVSLGQTRADGAVTLEAVYCLGLCANGPAALVDGRPVARLDASALGRLAEEVLA